VRSVQTVAQRSAYCLLGAGLLNVTRVSVSYAFKGTQRHVGGALAAIPAPWSIKEMADIPNLMIVVLIIVRDSSCTS
jgi:hypothetical protein